MINRVNSVAIYVADQDRAKTFYTEVLGFTLKTDSPFAPGASHRWIAVTPPDSETEIVLLLVDEQSEHYRQVVGQSQAITLGVTDMTALRADLAAKGVAFTMEPQVEPWGTSAYIQDSEGNSLYLVEPPKGA